MTFDDDIVRRLAEALPFDEETAEHAGELHDYLIRRTVEVWIDEVTAEVEGGR